MCSNHRDQNCKYDSRMKKEKDDGGRLKRVTCISKGKRLCHCGNMPLCFNKSKISI